MKKDMKRSITREELMTRIQVQNDQYSLKIEDRPTIAYFKKVLQAYDQKFEMVNA